MVSLTLHPYRQRISATAIFISSAILAGCSIFASADAKRGDQHLEAGRWEEASIAYKQALKDDPFDSSLQSKYAMSKEHTTLQCMKSAGAVPKIARPIWRLNNSNMRSLLNQQAQSISPVCRRPSASRSRVPQYHDAERLAQLGRTDEAMEVSREPLNSIRAFEIPWRVSVD